MMLSVLGLFACLCIYGTSSYPLADTGKFPTNEYEYSIQRDRTLAAQSAYEGHNLTLTDEEQIVNGYLEYLKWREFQATKDIGFPPSRPIEEQLDHIRSTDIYKALKKLPKGGNMHSHEEHELSKRTLLNIIFESEDFQYLWMMPPEHPTLHWNLEFYVNPPTGVTPGWVNVKEAGYTVEDMLPHQTLLGIMNANVSRYPTDSTERWRQIDTLWDRGSSQLVANFNIKMKYLQAMYEHGYDEGVIYFESRKSFGKSKRLFVMDPSGNSSATNGRLYLEADCGDRDVPETQNAVAAFRKDHPHFFGHKRISPTHRMNPVDVTKNDYKGKFMYEMNNVARLIKKFPRDVLGFDAVGQEDAGNSLLYSLKGFLAGGESLPLFLHNMETSWPDDLITSWNDKDPVATPVNGIDMLLLHAKRIGHGTGLIKHPYLVEMVRERGIAIEACTISSQILGYVPDLRQHPALHYYRAGIPIVLGADDPGTMGYDDFTVDWYEVYNAWGVDLSDLKKIALNSLWHSGMAEDDKRDAVENYFTPLWNKYIADMKEEACEYDYASRRLGAPVFGRILPREGANSGTTTVHVYGRNFETAICKTPVCRFGDLDTPAKYVDSNHLICEAPAPPDTTERTVSVFVALDGQEFLSTGEQFTYKYSPAVAAGRRR